MKLKLNIQRITIIIVVLFIIAGVLIIVLDWHDIRNVIGQANWWLILPAFLFTALSYYCLSYTMAIVSPLFGIRLGFRDLMEISFVSNVVTHLMNTGGVTGVSLQFVLMKKRGLATEDVLASSLLQLYFSSVMLIALLPIGLISILVSHRLSSAGSLGIGIAAGIMALLIVLAGIIMFAGPFRAAVFRGLGRLIHFVTRREITNELNDFSQAITRGISLLRRKPFTFGMLLLLAVGDWAGTVAALWFCFYALGTPIGLGTLLTGFSLGITAGFISLVPGGLGVQEGSMTGIFVLLGVSAQAAVLAAILFRIVYYFIPFLASLGFYHRLLREEPKNPPDATGTIVPG